jgi:hypothetical protein
MIIRFFSTLFLFSISIYGFSQTDQGNPSYWHNKEREVRYKPDSGDFVIENGTRRFNRALYGGNSPFRVETGDIPEFSMYLPGMGGNMKIGIAKGNQSKWVSDAAKYVARYSPGKMVYEITDPLLGGGSLTITVLALYEKEGIIVKVENNQTLSGVEIFCSYGGVTGKKFSRDGDLNIDPESNFYLKPEYCVTNSYEISKNSFILTYYAGGILSESERYENPAPGAQKPGSGSKPELKGKPLYISGVFPEAATVKVSDVSDAKDPLTFFASTVQKAPALCGKLKSEGTSYFILVNKQDAGYKYAQAADIFARAEKERLTLANRIKIETPDSYLNNLGGILGTAGDAVWETPTFLHGSVGWRIRLNGWRGPYLGDVLGWHDRARTHFDAYTASQVLSPDSGPSVPDPKYLLARQEEKMGNALFTSGYICRNPNQNNLPHHYDMNLVFIDALLRHYQWTGDLEYVKKTWPLLKRHIDWEKRNFKVGRDGLYDALCCIWASDALYYNGGGAAHSSAYNYYSNKTMAYLARLIGQDPVPYEKEAENIKAAMDIWLWYPSKGWYGEFRDYLGLKQVHPAAAIWTVYHTIDSEVPDPFKAYQMTEYVNYEIPHIPVLAKGLSETGNYVVSTTNWMPYDWSVNNVVFAESLHTTLAFWQAGRNKEATDLFKGAVLDAMYLGGSPGNFVQVSYYDAARGECYRDFADEIGMMSRTLVEGLFGIKPNLFDSTVTISPGFPFVWDHASISIPDIQFSFKREGNKVNYTIVPTFAKPVKIKFLAVPVLDKVFAVKVNGETIAFKCNETSIGHPQIEFTTEIGPRFDVSVEYAGNAISNLSASAIYALGSNLTVNADKATILDLFDPQGVLKNTSITRANITGIVIGDLGHRTFFVKVKQNDMCWWEPINIQIRRPIEIIASNEQAADGLNFQLQNNTSAGVDATIIINPGSNAFTALVHADGKSKSAAIDVPAQNLINGYNTVTVETDGKLVHTQRVANWMAGNPKSTKYEKVDLTALFNDKVTNIFKNQYLTPRCPYPTLSLPVTGIGEWCKPDVKTNIDDSGVRNAAGSKNEITTPQGVPFATPGSSDSGNIIFTSQWDNYPKEVSIPVNQSASHAYLLMAGSTNWMQSRFTNATVYAVYTDGSKDSLELRNPETWYPIEQDYYTDGYAFHFDAPRPQRLYLITAKFTFGNNSVHPDFQYNAGQIEGGAAIILDFPLNPSKLVRNFLLRTTANDIVVGLMSLTLAK